MLASLGSFQSFCPKDQRKDKMQSRFSKYKEEQNPTVFMCCRGDGIVSWSSRKFSVLTECIETTSIFFFAMKEEIGKMSGKSTHCACFIFLLSMSISQNFWNLG